MKTRVVITILLLVAMATAAARREYAIKSSHLGLNSVAITCENGADPTGRKLGEILVVSCGKE